MRGSVTLNELYYSFGRDDRAAMNTVIEENLELMKKTGLTII